MLKIIYIAVEPVTHFSIRMISLKVIKIITKVKYHITRAIMSILIFVSSVYSNNSHRAQ